MNFLLIEDHPVYSHGLKLLLKSKFDKVEIRVECDMVGALANYAPEAHDLIFLDMILHDGKGPSNISSLRRKYSQTPVIAYSGHAATDYSALAEDLCANAFFSKQERAEEILATIGMVLSGKRVFPTRGSPKSTNHRANSTPDFDQAKSTLTLREDEVVNCLTTGATNGQIALDLGICEKTVKAHLTSIFRKFGVQRRAEVIALHLSGRGGI